MPYCGMAANSSRLFLSSKAFTRRLCVPFCSVGLTMACAGRANSNTLLPAELLARVESGETVRVIVELQGEPEAVQTAQDRVLQEISGTQYSSDSSVPGSAVSGSGNFSRGIAPTHAIPSGAPDSGRSCAPSTGEHAMKGRQRLAILFLVLLITNLGAAALADPDAVARAHRQAGSGRFLVQLKVETSSEGSLRQPEAVAKQRHAIRHAKEALRSALAGRSHRVIREYRSIPFIAVEGGSDMLAALAPMASTVYRDHLFQPSLAESIPIVRADQAWTQGFDGSGSVVAILDTGVDPLHPFLAGKIVSEACYSGNGNCPNGRDTQSDPGAAVPCMYCAVGVPARDTCRRHCCRIRRDLLGCCPRGPDHGHTGVFEV